MLLQEEGEGVGLGRGGGDALGQPVGRDARAGDGGHPGAVGRHPGRRQPLGRDARPLGRRDTVAAKPLGRDAHAWQGAWGKGCRKQLKAVVVVAGTRLCHMRDPAVHTTSIHQ